MRQDEIKSDIDPSQLKSQLENRSLSSTGRDLAYLQKELDNHNTELRRGWLTSAPRNPGPVKVLLDALQNVRDDLAQREASEKQAGDAVADFEAADAKIEKITQDLSRAEERQELDRKYGEAETLYKQKEIEIGELTEKKARAGQLPQLLESAEAEFLKLSELLQKQKVKLAGAKLQAEGRRSEKRAGRSQATGHRHPRFGSPQSTIKRFSEPVDQFGPNCRRLLPIPCFGEKLAEGNEGLDSARGEEARLSEELEEIRCQLALLGQQETAQEMAIAKLETEHGLAEQARQLRATQTQASMEHKKISQKMERIADLVTEQVVFSRAEI